MEKRRIDFFDGLKFIACAGVFLTHFYGAFARLLAYNGYAIEKLNSVWLKALLDGDFQIGIFALISGFIAASSSEGIRDFKGCFKKCVSRYLRFVLPLFIITLIIYIAMLLGCFKNAEAGKLLMNQWYGGYYSEIPPVYDVVLSPLCKVLFFGDDRFDGPLWMLGYMFIGSLIVYLVSFIGRRFKKLRLPAAIAAAAAAYFIHYVAFACVLGCVAYCLYKPSENTEKSSLVKSIVAVIGIVFVIYLESGGYDGILLKFFPVLYLKGGFGLEGYKKAVLAFILVYSVLNTKYIKKLLGSKPLRTLGKYSFGIYLFHWPVICSAGAAVYLIAKPANMAGGVAVYFLLFGVCALLTGVLSYLFGKYAEPLCKKVSAYVVKKLFKD